MSALCDPLLSFTFCCPECGMTFSGSGDDFDDWSMPLLFAHGELIVHMLANHWGMNEKE